jgi:plasmid rolling circle replication initiator protein Rep
MQQSNEINTLKVLNSSKNGTNKTIQKEEGEALVIYGNNVALLEQQLAKRKAIYALRNDIGKHIKRVYPCGRFVQAKATHVSAASGKETGRSFFTNLQSCKSVWACPVCSLKISSFRAEQVRQMCSSAFEQGYQAIFMTFTMGHNASQSAELLQENMANAFRKLTRHKTYKSMAKSGFGVEVWDNTKYQQESEKSYRDLISIDEERNKKALDFLKIARKFKPAFIRALEVTKNENGWHPHLHILFFYKGTWEEDGKVFSLRLRKLWRTCLQQLGFKCLLKHQVGKPVYDQAGVSDYITKWDLSKELTEGHTKKSSRTPFKIFEEYQHSKELKTLNEFKEFALAFHGARQLTFSRGIKEEFLNMPDKSDDEIVKDEAIDKILFTMDLPLWREIKKKGLEADVLTAYDKYGFDGVLGIIDNYIELHVVIENRESKVKNRLNNEQVEKENSIPWITSIVEKIPDK